MITLSCCHVRSAPLSYEEDPQTGIETFDFFFRISLVCVFYVRVFEFFGHREAFLCFCLLADDVSLSFSFVLPSAVLIPRNLQGVVPPYYWPAEASALCLSIPQSPIITPLLDTPNPLDSSRSFSVPGHLVCRSYHFTSRCSSLRVFLLYVAGQRGRLLQAAEPPFSLNLSVIFNLFFVFCLVLHLRAAMILFHPRVKPL